MVNDKYFTAAARLPVLPVRPVDGHKGIFGTVVVIGGCHYDDQVMVGAPVLAARAALRAGCGLVKLAMPASIILSGLVMVPSATAISLPEKASSSGALSPSGSAKVIDRALHSGRRRSGNSSNNYALAIGPGWGVGYEQQQILIRLLSAEEFPVVLDADGLNNLAVVKDFARDIKAPLIVTPHVGEFGRLADALAIDVDDNGSNRIEGAEKLAQRLGCIVVLKGANTVVSDGVDSWVSPVVNSVLATAGTGDVLTGVIASLAAQHYKSDSASGMGLRDIACWGVLLHGLAADMWSENHGGCCAGMLAGELCDLLPEALGPDS